ncbi:S53 family peptidase [Streptomyces sp. bgisy034]|uniref:S53 family peptidase n=1 Tax=Streptomyces sp. bgisy034 TaxID=3413774 RepID=UPI003EBD6705
MAAPLTKRWCLLATASVATLTVTVPGCGDVAGPETGRAAAPAVADTVRASASPSASPSAAPRPFRRMPTAAECRARLGTACHTPDLVRTAYGIDKLNSAGLTGKGRTVVVYEEVVPDTLSRDLETFSRAMKLPKPDLAVDPYDPAGRDAPFDPENKAMAEAAVETTLAVQTVHMMAPDAKIVVTRIGLPEAARRTLLAPSGPPRSAPRGESAREAAEGAAAGAELILDGIGESVHRYTPDAISIGFGIPEYTAAGNSGEPADDLEELSDPLAAVVAGGTTLVAEAGDLGAAPPIGPGGERVRSVSWPASDPSVLALGASRLHLDDTGRRTGPDTVWRDRAGATGGGTSKIFARPDYQDRVSDVVDESRGTCDLSMDASASGGTLTYQGFLPEGAGWMPAGGADGAAPVFAALVALANERAGSRLGDIHDALYALARDPKGGVVDITVGNNGPDGFEATRGYDLASGLGTVDASVLVPKLADAAA